jgi:hypothetical protein
MEECEGDEEIGDASNQPETPAHDLGSPPMVDVPKAVDEPRITIHEDD